MTAKEQATEDLLRVSQEKEADYKRRLEAAEAQAAEAQAIVQAQAAAAAAAAATAAASELIERPHGSFSLPAILQQHGILSDEQLAIHVSAVQGMTYCRLILIMLCSSSFMAT